MKGPVWMLAWPLAVAVVHWTQPAPKPTIRTTPMTAVQWTAAYDECVKHLGTPIILAGRHPGISAGVGCIFGGTE